MSFGDNVFDYNVMLLKIITFPAPSGVEKQPCYGVGRHSPVAAGGEADAAYLWAVGEAGAFELLGEETPQKHPKRRRQVRSHLLMVALS